MTASDDEKDRNRLSLPDRLISVLEMFSEGEGSYGVFEIAERLNIPRSSVHRILASLVKRGIIEPTERRRYRIGTEMFRIAAKIEQRFELVVIAKPLMESITAECGETSALGLLTADRSNFMLAHKVDTKLSLRFKLDMLTNLDLIWGSLGRATLAWMRPNEVRQALLGSMPSPVSGNEAPSWCQLQQENEEVRRRGVAISHGHRAGPDIIGISSAFFDARGNVRGAIGVISPSFRFSLEHQARVALLVRGHAAKLSYKLGYTPCPRMPIAAGSRLDNLYNRHEG